MKIKLKIKYIFILISGFLIINANYAMEEEGEKKPDPKNLSYATARLEILPSCILQSSLPEGENEIRLIFIHPPKTGGTNIVNIMDALLGSKSHRFAVDRDSLKKGESPNLITPEWKGGFITLEKHSPQPSDDYIFISGHFPYGAHKVLSKMYPSHSYKYVTLVRSPLEREISAVNFDYQRGYIVEQQAEKYLLKTMIDNPQTRMLAGKRYMSGVCTEEALKKAEENLKTHFLVAGVTEDTNTFIQMLLCLLKYEQPIATVRSQVTGQKILDPNNLRADLKEKLLEKHKIDLELYKYVKEQWYLWKQEHPIEEQPIPECKKILTILPEFSNTHKPEYMVAEEIGKYNQQPHPEGKLIQLSQRHHGVRSEYLSEQAVQQ